ncbi:MAG: hypothetical protein QOH21_522 [Acidobacteriota bacterium]|jgi:hypothetical protein|nr:hypothetical protein [Acidobacteriota bacterium]
MIKRFLLISLLAASPLLAKGNLWSLTDARGDDYGNGALVYPMSADYTKGDLDLVRLTASRVSGGTMFEAMFARPIRIPARQTVDGIGTQLNDVARLGFYTFNIDIYIDTDGVAGSGSTTTLPGRQVMIDPSTAWEKVISLTPDPAMARQELNRIVVRGERRRDESEGKKGIVTDDERRALRSGVEESVFFPTQIQVNGSRVSFFVPDSFLGGEAKKDWSYVVAVSGADVIQRLDQQNRLMRRGDDSESLMILPVTPGRPTDRFGGALERDTFMPPLVDIIAVGDQKKVLSNYDADAGTPAVLTGVKP